MKARRINNMPNPHGRPISGFSPGHTGGVKWVSNPRCTKFANCFNLQDFDRILLVLNNLHEIYTDEDGPAIVFSCELGKGRTTTGMAIAALIYCNKKVNYGVILHILSLLCCYIIKPIVTFFFIKSIWLSFYRFICDVTRKLLFGALYVFMHNFSVFHVSSLGERCVPLPLTCALVRMPFS